MRKKILLGALTLLGLSFSMQATAQQQGHFSCGTQQKLQKLYADNPQLEQDYEALLEQYKEVRVVNGKKRFVYVIPIVFHIIHEYGADNITDLQVYDQMAILNEDFRMQNADTSDVVPAFDTLRADAMIEFRLPTLDPYGQCTNGIEHIYSHLANGGDDFSKLNQWNRARYLNVWVVNTIGEAGVAGYAYYPTATVGSFFFADGIIILSDYIGSIGTGQPFRSRALTHEIGHYLGLAHTWGSTNDPEVACGDDGVPDTPITKGHNNCNVLNDIDCSPGVIENVQNFMEYSYCSNMYTKDQATFMHNVLDQNTSSRNNLYSPDNHIATGVNVFPAPTCIPVADFTSDFRNICAGANVTFKDASWKAGVTSYEWTFPGGTPATSTSATPSVVYATAGFYPVTLKVTNAAGSDTKTVENMVHVAGNWAEYSGPVMNDFNTDANFWTVQNPENNHAAFVRVNGVGKNQSSCFMLNNFKDNASSDPLSEDAFYYQRLGGSKDFLISPAYDLSHTSNVSISFDYAYGTKATTVDAITEEVHVYVSRDCGETWTIRSAATLSEEEIVTAGYVGSDNFMPTNNSQWKTQTFTYTTNSQDTRTRFRIEFVASDNSSNFFFDNFNISGVLGIEENGVSTGVSLSPNPVATGGEISVQIEDAAENMQLQLVDVNGALISTTLVGAANGTQTVKIPMNVAKGCYFLQAMKGQSKSTHRVIVF